MISETSIRRWYTPFEVVTLRRWFIVSFVVNAFLLTVDALRNEMQSLALGLLGLFLSLIHI